MVDIQRAVLSTDCGEAPEAAFARQLRWSAAAMAEAQGRREV